jgi:hypothetical protein
MSKEVTYYEVFQSKFDKRNNSQPINIIAVISDSFRRIKKDYTLSSFKNYGYDALMPMAKKTYVALKAVSAQFITDCCKEIPAEKVDLNILLTEVNNLKSIFLFK